MFQFVPSEYTGAVIAPPEVYAVPYTFAVASDTNACPPGVSVGSGSAVPAAL